MRELSEGVLILVVMLLVIWFVFRIRIRTASIVKRKIMTDFPNITAALDNLQRKFDYFNVRLESLEQKLSAIEKKLG